MSATDRMAAAHSLHHARQTRTPIPPLTDADPKLSAEDAYAIQQELVAMLLSEDDSIVGYKLGLTSRPMQQLIGVDQPDYAPVLSSMVYEDGAAVELDRYIQPKVEAEIALVLERPLRGPGVTTLEAARATGAAVAAIEMIDSRIEDWKIKLADTIADLASSGAVVLGERPVPLKELDPRLVGMTIRRNGEVADTGAGAAALGNPVYAVAWLANTLARFDVTLEPEHFVMTGSLHAAFDVKPGDAVRADFDRLGSVRVKFV